MGMGSVGIHQLKYNNLRYDLLEIFVSISLLPPAFFFTRLSTLRSTSLCGMTYSKYLCQSLPLSPAFFSLVFLLFVLLLLSKKEVIFLHCSKMEADLKKQYLVYGIFFWPETWRGSLYILLPPLICQIPDFNYWTVLIFILIYFEWRDIEKLI